MSGRRANAMVDGKTLIVPAMMLLIVVAGVSAYFIIGQGKTSQSSNVTTCDILGSAGVVKSHLNSIQFGAVKEYPLPNPSRWSNAITPAPDGSVWFGEQSVPGVGHLYANGTLVEYPWPTAGWTTKGQCGYRTGIWGITFWNGMVWAADSDEDSLVGVNPSDGRTTTVNLTAIVPQPYTVAPSPDGSLWFTSLSGTARLGRLGPGLAATSFQVNGLNGEIPLQIDFVNSSYAYIVALNPLKPFGHLYAFNPALGGSTIVATKVGSGFQILEPSSVSGSLGHVWVTQHGTSSVLGYDPAADAWTTYPTSLVNFTYTTLPYFVDAQGDSVWFNEHYANRIALLDAKNWTLTEFSEANPPVENGSQIQNDLTIAAADGGLWFTSTTGNYVGFVDGSYRNSFALKRQSPVSENLTSGGSAVLRLVIEGTWTRPLRVGVSDSENYTSSPKLIGLTPSVSVAVPGAGPYEFQVEVALKAGLHPGRYTLAVSVSDGLVTESVYFFLTVS